MATQQARITGPVQYREGDGSYLTIRPGPVEIQISELDVTISWQDGESRGVASIPVGDYGRFLGEGAIEVAE